MIFWKAKFQFTMNVALSPNGLCMVSKPLHRLSNLIKTLVGLLTIHVVTHR